MDNRNKAFRSDVDFAGDDPIYSRLFIVCDKRTSKDEFEAAFSSFGYIEDIKIPLDTNREQKGVCYIKFSKTSEAAKAIEAMHMKSLTNSRRPMKVMVAVNRSEVERNDRDEEKYKRLFVAVQRNVMEDELEKIFAAYGRLRSLNIVRDHNTGESKGFAYLTYSKFSEAALAFEGCPRHFRPIFARPKFQKRIETSFESNIGLLATFSGSMTTLISAMDQESRNQFRGFTKINYLCSSCVSHKQMGSLFDLIPGMVDFKFFVDLVRNCGKGTVTYSNAISAAYAVEKLNEFEYPPGFQVYVKHDDSLSGTDGKFLRNIPGAVCKLRNAINNSTNTGTPDLAKLTEAIAEASKLVKMATGDATDDQIPDSNDINYCSVKLPPPQPLANIDSKLAKRCFLVCKPVPPPQTVLRDIFCRFGDLINVYTLINKTVGFARYASEHGANEAIRVLHGAEVCGVRMKVLEAEEEAPPKKRRCDKY